jgi:uncharacterized membrane protein
VSAPSPYYQPRGLPYPGPRRIHWLPILLGAAFIGVAALILLVAYYPSWFGLSAPASPYRYGFGGIFAAFFVLIVLFFIVRVAFWSSRAGRYRRRSPGTGEGNPGMNRPVMIARTRYARGEITREQYEQILKDLRRPPGAP